MNILVIVIYFGVMWYLNRINVPISTEELPTKLNPNHLKSQHAFQKLFDSIMAHGKPT